MVSHFVLRPDSGRFLTLSRRSLGSDEFTAGESGLASIVAATVVSLPSVPRSVVGTVDVDVAAASF